MTTFYRHEQSRILKAYNLKIVKGTAPDKFSPTNKITRQGLCDDFPNFGRSTDNLTRIAVALFLQ